MSGKEKFEEKNRRLDTALAGREPDRMPLAPINQTFGVAYTGHTMAEALYDFDVAAQAEMKFVQDFDPDICMGCSVNFAGYGPAFDLVGLKIFQWAGQKGSICSDMSIHQYVEKPYMSEDDYPALLEDMSGYFARKIFPQVMECAAPFAGLDFSGLFGMGALQLLAQFADPKFQEAVAVMGKAGAIIMEVAKKNAAFEQAIMEAGYPLLIKGMACAAFDLISDSLRGTIGMSEDILNQPDMVLAAIERMHRMAVDVALSSARMGSGKYVMIPLHKGIDSFMSDEHYAKFYWPTLKDLVEKIVEAGYTPYILTEGPYYSRLKYLEELPEHKVVLAFTDMDMAVVKKALGARHCITGGFNEHLLEVGTKQQVVDEVKRLLDICAPGGGYIFAVDRTLDYMAKPENVEAMCETVRTYGKY